MTSSKKVLGAMDCGCLILEREQIEGLSPTYYSVEYCPKHEAAPDMYEACLTALGVMATLDQNKGWVIEISNVIQKALSKARDKC